jgi:hypothetical protein
MSYQPKGERVRVIAAIYARIPAEPGEELVR